MKNKVKLLAIPVALTFLFSVTALCNSSMGMTTTNNNSTQQDSAANSSETVSPGRFKNVRGRISNIQTGDDHHRLSVTHENDADAYYSIHDRLYIYDLTTGALFDPDNFENDQEISVHYGINTPAALSFPFQINPDVILTGYTDESHNVTVDYFDEEGLSSDRMLKLNISETTEIIGHEEGSNLFGNNLIVLYSEEIQGTPSQATPEKVIVLPQREAPANEADEADEEEVSPIVPEHNEKYEELLEHFNGDYRIELNGKRFIALGIAAEQLGYHIDWDEGLRAVKLESTTKRICVTVDELEYSHSRVLGHFEVAPFIYNDRVFVEEEFLQIIV